MPSLDQLPLLLPLQCQLAKMQCLRFKPLLSVSHRPTVKEIMAKVISMQSADKYAGQNATFAMFCYKSDELQVALLRKWFIEILGDIVNQNAKKKMQKNAV